MLQKTPNARHNTMMSGDLAHQNMNLQAGLSFNTADDCVFLDGKLQSVSSLMHDLELKKENLVEPLFSLFVESMRSSLTQQIDSCVLKLDATLRGLEGNQIPFRDMLPTFNST